jgi:hypothetical protein
MSNEVTAIEKTSRGLAGAMFEELELLRSGKSNPQQARAKASIANTVCTISRLEMDFARFVAGVKTDESENGMKVLPMG